MGEVPSEIIILAKGDTKRLCPYDAEVWGVKDVGSYPECAGKRMDYIFDFEPRPPQYRSKLPGIPIVSWQDYADIKYPLEEIQERFSCYGEKEQYFTNTVSYQIAYALYLGVKKIRMYGADAPFGYPYFLEKSGIEYWIGRAKSLGAKIEISEGSHLLRTKDGQLYGMPLSGSVLLYLSERLALLSLLPRIGRWEDIYVSQLAQAVLAVTIEEGEEHKISISTNVNGTLNYKCDHEFTKAVWLPVWAWHYLRDMLQGMEANGQLPISALAVYDKIVKYGRVDEVDYQQKRMSYILITKNRAKFLENSLQNLKKLLTEDDELIVVDGNSTDGSKEVINKYGRLITNLISENDIGAAHAFNKGVLASTGRYIMQYCDDDMIYPDAVKEAVDFMDKNPEIDLLVCSGTKKTGGRDMRVYMPEDYGKPSDVFIYGACGNGFVYRREVFSKVGLLNTKHRIPDQEYALRVMESGNVRMLDVNMYLHPIYTHSTSLRNPDEWREQHQKLIDKYCSKLWQFQNALRRYLQRVRGKLRRIQQL